VLCWCCSGHVLTEDTSSQNVTTGHLYTKRLLTKTNHLPRWGERFMPGPRHVCIIEESVVDPKTQTLTTYTRNIGYTTIMVTTLACSFVLIFRWNRFLQHSNSPYSFTFLCCVVCLSVCLIRAPCLNRSMDFDAVWQVHLWDPMTHCVRWGPWPQGRGDLGPNPAANCKLANAKERFRLSPNYFGPCLCFLLYSVVL